MREMQPMTVSIHMAVLAADYDAYGQLCRDYVDWCRARYAHDAWFVNEVFGYQAIDEELKDLPVKYGPPKGMTLLVAHDGEIVGGGAYRRTSETVCEMKRLYISTAAAGRGLGRQLANALIDAARAEGFTLMQLDTGNLLKEAIAMYESLGFRHIAPYNSYPEKLMPYLVFMEKDL